MIRIANGQGFWGDWLDAPRRLVEDGPLNYLTLDYLAEVTMSILQKQRKADARLGYARDFPPLMASLSARLRAKKVRVIANAGGVNPVACAREIRRLAPELKVAVVLGDDILGELPKLRESGHELRNMDTREPLSAIEGRVLSANVYMGAFPLAQALAKAADVIITGRCADAALALAPMIYEFGWTETDWDLLASGVVAGHAIECGAQATGGNCSTRWETTPDFAHIGYPIIEAEADGRMTITKHAGTGGRVTEATVKEQLLYEILDPARYMTPDVVADFTSIELTNEGTDRVGIRQVKGSARPDTLKVSISYHYGWKAVGTLVYCAPKAMEKAQMADRVVRERLDEAGFSFEKIHTELFGVNACLAHLAPHIEEAAEVQIRIGVRDADKSKVERFTRELIPLVLSGPPTATGYGEGRPVVREIVAFWPALVSREVVNAAIEVVE